LQFKEKMRQILAVKDSPRRIAASFAVGVFIGMSPLLGIHTLLGMAIAWQFRLNKFVTLIGVYVTNPWTIVPIYTFGTWVGAKVVGLESIIPRIDWSRITFLGLLGHFRPLLLPFVIGNTLIGLIAAGVGYFLIYVAVKSGRA
jgi:uncharacterized protein (DUF2062 family)